MTEGSVSETNEGMPPPNKWLATAGATTVAPVFLPRTMETRPSFPADRRGHAVLGGRRYNRLVRLRSDANAAFATLDAELLKQVHLVHQGAAGRRPGAVAVHGGSASWGRGCGGGGAAPTSASLTSAKAPRPPDCRPHAPRRMS